MGMETDEGSATAWTLQLLDGFEARRDDEVVAFPAAQQRLIAFLALDDGTAGREYVAGSLWPETSDHRAAANLRSALWRLRRPGCDLLAPHARDLRLDPRVRVDAREAIATSYRLLADPGRGDPDGQADAADDFDAAAFDGDTDALSADALIGELLPGWEEPWVRSARERLRQLRAHALEARGAQLVAAGRITSAVHLAEAAVAADPGRESAHRLLLAAQSAQRGA